MLYNLMIYPLPSRSIFTLYQALLSLHSLKGMLNVELLVEDFTVNILARLLRRLFHSGLKLLYSRLAVQISHERRPQNL